MNNHSPLWNASLALTPEPGTSLTRNPATGMTWRPGELDAALAAVRADALKSTGTAGLPEDAGRDPETGLWRSGR